jgi:nicotinate-nucleotide pyrophosphorylase (carboxylating)
MSTLRNRFAPFDAALASAFEQNIAAALAEDIGAGDCFLSMVWYRPG